MNDEKSAGTLPSSEKESSDKRSQNTAKNILDKGICKACDNEQLDPKSVGIQCWCCKLTFHAIGCKTECVVSANSAFTTHLLPAVNNEPPYEKRFGRFLFVCDYCMTRKETERAEADADRVGLLEEKFDTMQKNFMTELTELKTLLKCTLQPNQNINFVSPSLSQISPETNQNLWNDSQRVDNLRQKVLIKKKSDGTPICQRELEKIYVENGLAVHKTRTLEKSKDTEVLLNSKKDVDVLMVKLGEQLPGHQLEMKSAMKPTITIVGLTKEYDKSELIDMIKSQNDGISALCGDKTAEIGDKYIDVINISVINAYKGKTVKLYKAIVRVSNLIRSIVAKQGNRLFLGGQTNKIYDSFFVLRCYKCQEFGHHSKDCTNNSVCGYCAEGHQTLDCTAKKVTSSVPSCANCKHLTPGDDIYHEAGSFACPILKSKQDELKKRIPFYQKK